MGNFPLRFLRGISSYLIHAISYDWLLGGCRQTDYRAKYGP